MSIAEKDSHKPGSAQQVNVPAPYHASERLVLFRQKPKFSFSLSFVVLLGIAAGISLVIAVMLLLGKAPGDISASALTGSSGMNAGTARPISQSQQGTISTPANSAKSAAVKSKPEVQQSAEADVRAAVTQWAEAWSRRDTASYLACYASGFSVPEGLSRAEWEAQRKSRLAKPRLIEVALKQVEVSLSADGIATARFMQDFRADAYREAGVKKELRLKHENGRWLIVGEKAV